MNRFATRALLASAVLAPAVAARSAEAQYASYTGTYFVHGLNETSAVWTTRNTTGRLATRVDPGAVRLPNTTALAPIDYQAGELAGMVRGEPAGSSFFFVAHSMGGPVSRDVLLSSNPQINTASRVAGVVTVASPNKGAPVAEKAQQYDPRTTLGLIEGLIHTIRITILSPIFGLLDAIISSFVRTKLDQELFSKLNETAKGLKAPGAIDLRPSSATIQFLGNTGDGVPHSAVWGSVPQQYSWARLAASREYADPEAMVRSVRSNRSNLKLCAALFYNIIIKTGTGKACRTGERAIGGFDDRWKEWVHFSYARNSATDGLLPEETLRYPLEYDAGRLLRANGTEDHFSIMWRDPGVNRIADGMLAARMRPAAPPPPTEPDPYEPPSNCGYDSGTRFRREYEICNIQ
jgi:pimeloyl-ACP methyl ester carboxylesterase